MTVITNLPRWAQSPVRAFLQHGEVPGSHSQPLTPEGFEDTFKLTSGVFTLAAYDEVPGEDLAMGQPGTVRRNGVTVYSQGDSSRSDQTVEAVMVGRRRGIEYATYAQSSESGFRVLAMVNDEGTVSARGGWVDQTPQGPDGYLVSGEFSASTGNESTGTYLFSDRLEDNDTSDPRGASNARSR